MDNQNEKVSNMKMDSDLEGTYAFVTDLKTIIKIAEEELNTKQYDENRYFSRIE